MSNQGNHTVTFRCLFGEKVGLGHVVRCSALAEAFKGKGWTTQLWSSCDYGGLPRSITSVFDRFSANPAPTSVLVIDEMYTSDEAFASDIEGWRKAGGAIVAGVDDMQKRLMSAFDVTINTELGLETANYVTKEMLLGERFALLRNGFANPQSLEAWEISGDSIPVFVMIGGTDAFGYLGRVLAELKRWNAGGIAPVIAVGNESSLSREILDTISGFEYARVLIKSKASELSAWMKRCRFGIVGCGTSVYELAALELPFIGLSLIDNQSATAKRIVELWGMPVVFREGINEKNLDLQQELNRVLTIEKKAYSKVDTNGAERVCSRLVELAGN